MVPITVLLRFTMNLFNGNLQPGPAAKAGTGWGRGGCQKKRSAM